MNKSKIQITHRFKGELLTLNPEEWSKLVDASAPAIRSRYGNRKVRKYTSGQVLYLEPSRAKKAVNNEPMVNAGALDTYLLVNRLLSRRLV